jgi:multiple sugar transport system ATP-binding protein
MLPMPPGARNANGAAPGIYGIRPEHMRLMPNGGGLPATVQLVEPTGSETQVVARIGDTPLTCAFRERVAARPGDTIGVLPDLDLVHLFDSGTGRRLAA